MCVCIYIQDEVIDALDASESPDISEVERLVSVGAQLSIDFPELRILQRRLRPPSPFVEPKIMPRRKRSLDVLTVLPPILPLTKRRVMRTPVYVTSKEKKEKEGGVKWKKGGVVKGDKRKYRKRGIEEEEEKCSAAKCFKPVNDEVCLKSVSLELCAVSCTDSSILIAAFIALLIIINIKV